MSDCCSTNEKRAPHPKKHCCPESGFECVEVPVKTILYHLKQPWKWKDEGLRYYFCPDPDCEAVYFSENDTIISKAQLRTTVGIKEKSNDAPACYCFGVSKTDAINDPSIREYVMAQTKSALCACEVKNPSGRCCLKDFPRIGQRSGA